jgi:dissimilatory sulfite reductase (desulfoviridin) alpha/beta subunit
MILQALILIIVLFYNLNSEEKKRQRLGEWFGRLGWADFITDLVHLMLLVIIEDYMMDVVGHSNLHMW